MRLFCLRQFSLHSVRSHTTNMRELFVSLLKYWVASATRTLVHAEATDLDFSGGLYGCENCRLQHQCCPVARIPLQYRGRFLVAHELHFWSRRSVFLVADELLFESQMSCFSGRTRAAFLVETSCISGRRRAAFLFSDELLFESQMSCISVLR